MLEHVDQMDEAVSPGLVVSNGGPSANTLLPPTSVISP